MNIATLRYHAYQRGQHLASFLQVEDAVRFIIERGKGSLHFESRNGKLNTIWINQDSTASVTVEQGVQYALEWQAKVAGVAA